jgi:uncharacterized protein
MQINLETPDQYTVQSYNEHAIVIHQTTFTQSLIVSRHGIISPWAVGAVGELTEEHLAPLLSTQPEIILIGQHDIRAQIPMPLLHYLSKQRIGIECMSIGAASRTYNVLLSEQRAVALGIIFHA